MPAVRNSTEQVGKRFGRLQVVAWGGHKIRGSLLLTCFCDCGTWKHVKELDLLSGHSRSCGCLHHEQIGDMMRTHGLSISKEHAAWRSMKERCHNPRYIGFKNYGGRGIKICDRWLNSFENFYADMGPKPSPRLTLHRVNNDGDYCKENCVWATRKVQGRAKTNTLWIEYKGVRKALSEWAEELGLRYGMLIVRIQKLGWTPEKAFTTKTKKQKGR